MSIALEHGEESSVIGLEGVIDIASAAELKTALVDALKSGNAVRVSLGRVTDLDVTAVQLLWAAEREARAAGVEFALRGQVPETVTLALADAGFEALQVTA